MSTFNERWTELASRARATPRGDETAPHGFATRVVALAAESGGGLSAEDLWLRWTRRSVLAVAVVGVVMGAMDVSAGRPHGIANPGVENTVAQVLWTL